jgi:hypothetical protein
LREVANSAEAALRQRPGGPRRAKAPLALRQKKVFFFFFFWRSARSPALLATFS